MTKRAAQPPRDWRSAPRSLRTLVALGMVWLQLVTALHFALIPHGFNANLGAFEHVHAAPASAAAARQQLHGGVSSFVSGVASCAPESCPIGFAGPVSALFARAALSGLIALPVLVAVAPRSSALLDRASVLRNAPKTSPPAQA